MNENILKYQNPDWDMAKKRLEAFWHHEIIDRPCLQVYVDTFDPEPMEACSYADRWLDPETFVRIESNGVKHRRYLGEGYPSFYPNWEGISAMLGCNAEFDKNTIWIRPIADSVLDLDFSGFSFDSDPVKKQIAKLSRIAEICSGQYFLAMPPFGNSGDNLAMALGYENLCFDLVDEPERVLELDDLITGMWKKLYDAFRAAITQHMDGMSWWLPAWHPGRSALIEFDFGALISPEMYKMFLPHLIERAEYVDNCIYHLDGPGALPHLDTILAQKEFDAVQWEPGAGGGTFLSWLPVMKRIQEAGKGLYVGFVGVETDEALQLLKELKPEGLIMPVHANSMDEANRFLDTVNKMF